MTTEEFLRIFPLRASNLMWFLGAGASASAGVPTGGAMIWDFKRTLYCAANKVSIRTCDDLADPNLRGRLQRFFDSKGTYPRENSPDEYAYYFEATYPDASDRRRKIERFVSEASPSFGHKVLSGLAKVDQARVIWTTNFDRVVEDGLADAFGGSAHIVVATLDSASVALEAINEGRWPVVGKLHGDFQSKRLKNTSYELRKQDEELRHALVESCKRYGLVIAGYSGRDESVMNALTEAIADGRGYPSGLFWFHRPQNAIFDRVSDLVEKARHAGINAEIIELQTFDELMGDIFRQLPDVPSELAARLNPEIRRISEKHPVAPGTGWPVIRMNALPFAEWPTMCRRVVCTIGNTKEVRQAIAAQSAAVVAARRDVGVLAFGSDAEIRRTFSTFSITEFDFHSIEVKRLRFDSTELGLLRDVFAMYLSLNRPLLVERRRSTHLLKVDASRATDQQGKALASVTGQLRGVIKGINLGWCEAAWMKISYDLDRLWLVFEPTIAVEHTDNNQSRYTAADFVRERMATRYNRQWNALIDAWVSLLMENKTELRVQTFGISDGADARFALVKPTAFSRRYEK